MESVPANLILAETPLIRAFIVLTEELHSVLDQLFKHDISPSYLTGNRMNVGEDTQKPWQRDLN